MLAETGVAASVDDAIATVDHVFDLVHTKEAIESEDELAAG